MFFFRVVLPGWYSSLKICPSVRSPLNAVASNSTSFETVMTVEIGPYRRRRRRYASSPSGSDTLSTNRCAGPPRQHDQHATQLNGNVENTSSFKSRRCERQVTDGRQFVLVSFHVFANFCQCATKESSRPTAKTRDPVLATCRAYRRTVEAVLRRARADPLLLLRWSCGVPSLLSSLLRSRQVLLCSLSLSLSVLLGLLQFVLSRSTHACQQGAAACPSCSTS